MEEAIITLEKICTVPRIITVMRKQSWSALRPALGICRKKGAERPYEGYTLGSRKWRGLRLREENGVGSSPEWMDGR